MRFFFSFIIFIVTFSINAQDQGDVGTYELKLEATNATIIDTLILNSNGTFTFHEYDKHNGGIPQERDKYGKGTWKLEKKIIHFYTDKNDFDKIYTLDFNNTKARFITKPSRDKSNEIIPVSLKFIKSDIFWIVRRQLVKI